MLLLVILVCLVFARKANGKMESLYMELDALDSCSQHILFSIVKVWGALFLHGTAKVQKLVIISRLVLCQTHEWFWHDCYFIDMDFPSQIMNSFVSLSFSQVLHSKFLHFHEILKKEKCYTCVLGYTVTLISDYILEKVAREFIYIGLVIIFY